MEHVLHGERSLLMQFSMKEVLRKDNRAADEDSVRLTGHFD